MPEHASPPPRRLLAAEPLGLLELPAVLASAPFLAAAPRGPDHAVLVLPGFGADDGSTALMRAFLRTRGYRVHGWELGRNTRPPRTDLPKLEARVRDLRRDTGRPVSLVGWSRGGIMAREIARAIPEAVRLVVTLGSPFAAPMANNVGLLRRRNGPDGFVPESQPRVRLDPRPIPVPATSIYTKRDGVVAWQACLDRAGPKAENIQVSTTHIGLGFHPPALWVVADRLAQPMGEWAPFKTPAHLRPFFPAPEQD